MAWFRWYEEATSDPKFMVVSRRTGHPVAFVVAVWAMLLERANSASARGWITGFDCESADALLGMPDGAAESILDALRVKGLLDGEDGDHVAKWEERQPKREDGSAERAKEWRERKKLEANAQNAPVNAGEQARTQPNARREENRREENTNTASAPPSAMPLASPAAERSFVSSPVGGEEEPATVPPASPPALSLTLSQADSPSRPHGKGKSKSVEPPDEPYYRAKSGRFLTGKRLTSFERFWTAFAFAKGKAEAAEAWLGIPALTDALVDEICRATELEAMQRVKDTARGKSPKWPQGWLTARRWEDYEPVKPLAKTVAQGMNIAPLCEPTPEELEANPQRALRHVQRMQTSGILPGAPVQADFRAAVAAAGGGQA